MKRLLKAYGLQTEAEYYEMIRNSFINGQRVQAKEQFKAMPKEYRIAFVKECIYECSVPASEHIYYFNILTGQLK